MPYLVREHLFLGDITHAAEVLQHGNPPEITHVLSLLSSPAISAFSEWRANVVVQAEEIKTVLAGDDGGSAGRKALPPRRILYSLQRTGPGLGLLRMAVPIKDTEDQDLLDYLDVCLDFIEEGRKQGAILVHCFAGVSRSASVIAAYLMKTEQKSLEDALESLNQVSAVCPNDGFLYQLSLFEEMGFKVDTSSKLYRRFRLKVLGHSYNIGEKIDSCLFGADPGLPSEPNSSDPKTSQQRAAYCCKKCKRIVALEDHIVSHVPGESEFDLQEGKFLNQSNKVQDLECPSLFIEPLKWMTSVEEGGMEGKLSCIGCKTRLGHFNWLGIQCSCGSWVTPGFEIYRSEVVANIPLKTRS